MLWDPRVSTEKPRSTGLDVAACFLLVGTTRLPYSWPSGYADGLKIHWGLPAQVRILLTTLFACMPRRSVCAFFHVPSMLFRSLSASDKHAAGPFCSRETVACRDRIVVSTLRCGRSNPGHGRLLPSGSFLPPHPSAGFCV